MYKNRTRVNDDDDSAPINKKKRGAPNDGTNDTEDENDDAA
jgi:hypothetical protein